MPPQDAYNLRTYVPAVFSVKTGNPVPDEGDAPAMFHDILEVQVASLPVQKYIGVTKLIAAPGIRLVSIAPHSMSCVLDDPAGTGST